ncbi:MAG: hypothetical protein AB7M12_12365 [Hyphomonadaceae bacterium]
MGDAHPDRTVGADALRERLPAELAPLVDNLPRCDDCNDVFVDSSIGALMLIGTQNPAWQSGAVASCKRILDREQLS